MKRKNISYLLLSSVMLLTASCKDYLSVDHYFNDRQSEERIFRDKDYTNQWLANCYNQLLSYNLEIGHRGLHDHQLFG